MIIVDMEGDASRGGSIACGCLFPIKPLVEVMSLRLDGRFLNSYL